LLDRLIDSLRRLWRRLTRGWSARRGGRAHGGIPLGGGREPAEYARGIPWVPRSDGRPFNPQDSRVLKALQRRATYALFAELGQKWVPAEMFRMLDAEALPSRALELFCAEFGINTAALQQGSADEIANLTHCLDLLFFVHDIGARLPSATRERIVAAIRARDYDAAAGMVDVFRLALRALDDAVEMEKHIPFPLYREFVAYLRGFGDDWLRLSLPDVEAALAACHRYRALNDRFNHGLARLDARLEWVSKQWPGNQWGRDNRPARDAMIAARGRLEREIRAAAGWDMARLDAAIAAIEQLVADFDTLLATMKGQGRYWRQTWDEQPYEPGNSEAAKMWVWALEALGLERRRPPDAAAIRTAFCRQALRFHPDRNSDQPDELRQYYRERFEEATRAREILDRGAPFETTEVNDMTVSAFDEISHVRAS
jgi:hypothetical protein